jgi:hypothetical protein
MAAMGERLALIFEARAGNWGSMYLTKAGQHEVVKIRLYCAPCILHYARTVNAHIIATVHLNKQSAIGFNVFKYFKTSFYPVYHNIFIIKRRVY